MSSATWVQPISKPVAPSPVPQTESAQRSEGWGKWLLGAGVLSVLALVLLYKPAKPNEPSQPNENPPAIDAANNQVSKEDSAISAYKNELVKPMIQGLASSMPEVRQNARRALRNLGVTEEQMDQLRLKLEQEKQMKQR
jgi:hypothetical protein